MKSLLFLSYYFPPHGGGGVLRPVETVRFLENYGWRATVIAGPRQGYWLEDPGLESRVPAQTAVAHTRALTGPQVMRFLGRKAKEGACEGRSERTIGWFRRLTDWLPLPDVYAGWIPFACAAALKYAAGADCILSTSPPESSHLAGWYLARKTGKRWIADFRDPWIRGIYRRYPTGMQKSFQERLERLVVERADMVVATTEQAASDFRSRYPGLPGEKFRFIPNGFDSAEFHNLKNTAPRHPPLKIIHAGGLVLGRDPEPLFQALIELNKEKEDCCHLELVGVFNPHFREKAKAMGLGSAVTFTEYLPRKEVLNRISGSHLGLLLESFSPGAELVVPGKFYDYLGAGLPVLALVPPGAAAEAVNRTGSGLAITEPDSGKIAAALRNFLERLENGRELLDRLPDQEAGFHL